MPLLLFAFSWPAFCGTLSVTPTQSAATEVLWSDGGAAQVLERFVAAEQVFGSGVSDDGRWGFVWHTPRGKSRQVSVYDLREKRRVALFMPGYGGELRFSAANTLVLTHGCGTSCHVVTVFDLTGKELLGVGGSMNDVSPDRRHVLVYPSLESEPCPVALYDLGTGRRLAELGLTESGELGIERVTWAADGTGAVITVARRDGTAPSRQLRVSVDGTSSWVGSPPQ